ncbi:hypothetical protein GGS23DRAFT_121152 [Durotheca rogersii]|uniref:uncharacterized protein n=1 Tax=Durotheca rogersii TaxID=419775 RepID=UPI0022211286|nr:uncharacterized protein GGS23DRAFT_121152 [Durotheca rogersii]KAI5861970.1 hypothetical protein GGS23DRAFT_121152 [Durotheca rogersii]
MSDLGLGSIGRREELDRQEESSHQRTEASNAARRELEVLDEGARPQSLTQYLDACRALRAAARVVREPLPNTQGDTNQPEILIPQDFIPWEDFREDQEEIWQTLLSNQRFSSEPIFPSTNEMLSSSSAAHVIRAKRPLRDRERLAVQHPVQTLVNAARNDGFLWADLGLDAVTLCSDFSDDFYICEAPVGPRTLKVAVEYVAPHQLTTIMVATSLDSPFKPEPYLRGPHLGGAGGADAVSWSRSLVADVVSRTFGRMVANDVQFGYVCTEEALVFLHIPDNAAIVHYYVCIPNMDVVLNEENKLYHTAVARVFAFVIQALRLSPPPAAWHITATQLPSTRCSNYDNLFREIQTAMRQSPPCFDHPGYDFRSLLLPENSPHALQPEESARIYQPFAHSSPHFPSCWPYEPLPDGHEYCTNKCLLGLVTGAPVDPDCPNAADHGSRHPKLSRVLSLVRLQLVDEGGPSAGSEAGGVFGSVGTLFNVRTPVYGYTLVAKGVQREDMMLLRLEHQIYDWLRKIQGVHVPVCVGRVRPGAPYKWRGGSFVLFLLLSWAGTPLVETPGLDAAAKRELVQDVAAAYGALHKLRILHGDSNPYNVLFDPRYGRPVIIDFEQSTVMPGPPGDDPDWRLPREWRREVAQEVMFSVSELEAGLGLGSSTPSAGTAGEGQERAEGDSRSTQSDLTRGRTGSTDVEM